MKLIKITLVVVLAVVIAAALWFYRPWSQYSPANFRELEQPEKLTYNFTHMAELIPSRVLAASANPAVLEVGELSDIADLSYSFAGEEKTIAQFVGESSTLGLLVLKDGRIVHESYFQGTDQETLYTSWSMAKKCGGYHHRDGR